MAKSQVIKARVYPRGTVVYKITNLANNKVYVGHTVDIRKRVKDHRQGLIKGIHHSSHLQKSYNKYGIDNFEVSIIEFCNNDDVIAREQYWMNHFKSNDRQFGYNFADARSSALGLKRSPETLIKMRDVRLAWRTKDIVQSDLKGNIIKVWHTNPSLVAKELGISRPCMSATLSGRQKTAQGFTFKYRDIQNG